MHTRRKHIWLTGLVGIAWAGFVAAGVRGLLKYESTPGQIAAVPESWPASQVPLAKDGMTIVMLAHPLCPCTRASVNELAKVMADVQGAAVAYVLFSKPADTGDDWRDTELERTAAAIPGVTTVMDRDAVEARRFGAETSGHTLLFAADGRLLFTGGITASRGHEGDNEGESAIVSLVHHRPANLKQTSVFGCALPTDDKHASRRLVSR